MPGTDLQNISEMIEAADVAVRVASQLRQNATGRDLSDLEVLERGIEFIERARSGGAFMANQRASQLQAGASLRPLNWATDSYLLTTSPTPTNVDFKEVASFLESLGTTLKELSERRAQDPARLRLATKFFEALGENLQASVSRLMRRESSALEAGV